MSRENLIFSLIQDKHTGLILDIKKARESLSVPFPLYS